MIKTALGGSSGVYTLALATFVVGIAIGSLLAARMSHTRPNLALVPLGAILMGLAALALAALAFFLAPPAIEIPLRDFVTSKRGSALMVSLFVLAAGAGLYIVPAFAAVQSWAAVDRRARVVAAVNVMNAAYMTIGGALLAGLQLFETPLWLLFCVLGVATLAVAGIVTRLWGQEGVRDGGRGIFQLASDLKNQRS